MFEILPDRTTKYLQPRMTHQVNSLLVEHRVCLTAGFDSACTSPTLEFTQISS